MRMSHNPPWLLAKSQLPRADTRDPRCNGPVGDGANRPTILLSSILIELAMGEHNCIHAHVNAESQGKRRKSIKLQESDISRKGTKGAEKFKWLRIIDIPRNSVFLCVLGELGANSRLCFYTLRPPW
jgi:hypothetical protein